MHHQAKTKLFAFMATVLALSLLAVFALDQEITVGTLKEYTQSFGAFAPLIYVLIFTLVPLTLIPNSLLAISGGALFGLYYGSLYTLIGAAFGATLSFVGSGAAESSQPAGGLAADCRIAVLPPKPAR